MQIKFAPLRRPILLLQPAIEETRPNAAICPAPSPPHPDADGAGAGGLGGRTTGQDLRLKALRAVPLDRPGDAEPAQGRAALPHPAQPLSGRNPVPYTHLTLPQN